MRQSVRFRTASSKAQEEIEARGEKAHEFAPLGANWPYNLTNAQNGKAVANRVRLLI